MISIAPTHKLLLNRVANLGTIFVWEDVAEMYPVGGVVRWGGAISRPLAVALAELEVRQVVDRLMKSGGRLGSLRGLHNRLRSRPKIRTG